MTVPSRRQPGEMTALGPEWLRAALALLAAIRRDGLAADAAREIEIVVLYLHLAEIEWPYAAPSSADEAFSGDSAVDGIKAYIAWRAAEATAPKAATPDAREAR
jgi:hypothetical protein